MPEAAKWLVITVVAPMLIVGGVVWVISSIWCLAWGHVGRVVCDWGETDGG